MNDPDDFKFEIMDLGDEVEEAYAKKSEEEEKKRVEEVLRIAFNRKKAIDKKGVCEGCDSTEYLRWLNGDCICYACYYEGMKQWGELSTYHGRRAEDMDGFVYDDEWEELWEEEQKDKKIKRKN